MSTTNRLLVLAVLWAAGQASSFAQDANVKIRGGCEIIAVRSGPSHIDYSFCDKLPPIEYKTYGWLVPVLSLAFDNAERVSCGSLRCAVLDRTVDLVVTANAFGNAGVSWNTPRVADSDRMVFFFTTGIADLIQASTTGYMFDTQDRINGLHAWLREIDRRANSDCEFRVPAPFRPLNADETKIVFQTALVMYQFILGHEFAHVALGSDCGVASGGALAQETACDRFAFDRHWKAQAIAPQLVIIPTVAMAHYDSLLDERWGTYFFAESGKTLKEALPAADWITRGKNILRWWRGECQASTGANHPACQPLMQGLYSEVANYLDLDVPRACHDTESSRSKEWQPAGSMEGLFCSRVTAIMGDHGTAYSKFRGKEKRAGSSTRYELQPAPPGTDFCNITVRDGKASTFCAFPDTSSRVDTIQQFLTLTRQVSTCLPGYEQTKSGDGLDAETVFRGSMGSLSLSMSETGQDSYTSFRIDPPK